MAWKDCSPAADGMIGVTWIENAKPAPNGSEVTVSPLARAPELGEGIDGHYAPDGEAVIYPVGPTLRPEMELWATGTKDKATAGCRHTSGLRPRRVEVAVDDLGTRGALDPAAKP